MPTPATNHGTVLLVDDDDLFLKACGAILRRAGFTVEPVSSAQDALERIGSRRYDAIVSDIRMPDADGLTLLRSARAADADVPFVLMTGCPSVESAMTAVELGAVRYLAKPFDIDDFTATVTQAVARRGTLAPPAESALFDRALAHVWMAYQPIVRCSTRSTVAFEALVRCSLPEIHGPADLLALAERTNRLIDLGRTIRRKVAEDAKVLPPHAQLFVNLHPADLADPSLLDAREPLAEIADRVVLEITERASVTHLESLDDVIAAVRRIGYRVAIDDLGAGYSGLSSIARVRPEFVKLDASLVRGVGESVTQKIIVGAVVALCAELNADVIAEAIETEAERDALKALGLDWMQGFHFARPSPPFIPVNDETFDSTPVMPAVAA